ncbi:MAG: signal transduction histidine kinase, partial [Myxococcota bacterium]
AERLGRPRIPTLIGEPIAQVVSALGTAIDAEATAYSIAATPLKAGRTVHVSQIELPSDVVGSCEELWLFTEAASNAAPAGSAEASSQSIAVESNAAALERMKRELLRHRDEQFAQLSHELRTPLTIMLGYSNLLLAQSAGTLSAEQRGYLEESRRSCQSLNRLVVDLLDASHDQSSRGWLRLEEASMATTLQNVVAFFLPLFDEKDLSVELKVAPELPAGRFDVAKIEQVVTNLLGNAVKYTKIGGAIQIAAESICRDGKTVIEVAVQDDGPGIAANDAKRIFDPYIRGADDRQDGGVGLGLAICRRILEAHDGEIGVDLAVSKGSRFVFCVPAISTTESTRTDNEPLVEC